MVVALVAALVTAVRVNTSRKPVEQSHIENTLHFNQNGMIRAGIYASFEEHIFCFGVVDQTTRVVERTREEKAAAVYSFLQGPKAYEEGYAWGGSWCQQIVRGRSFGGFGCGMCCMANIYSTLSPYECSPWDMYQFATEESAYYPTKESGAIGWKEMKHILNVSGFDCKLRKKPATYEEFQAWMEENQTAVVLVSSYNDSSFWENTGGHYVNIWMYDKKTDEVFLTEPGNPETNRTFIPLRYVYDALKTVSQYQFLTVKAYNEDMNIWKHDGITDVWNGK